jgi:hypothetical protein
LFSQEQYAKWESKVPINILENVIEMIKNEEITFVSA